jgi:hypothetical protein
MTGQFIHSDMSGMTAETHKTLAQLVSEQTLLSWTPPYKKNVIKFQVWF